MADLEFSTLDNQIITDGGNNLIVNVNPVDVSGGGTSGDAAASAQQIEEFEAEGGGLLAIVYGEHIIAGHLIVHKFTAGSPNASIFYVALGEGWGEGGSRGDWDSAVAVYYNGATVSVSPDASTAGYRFHAGEISSGVASGNQQVDAFLSGNNAYSGTAYVAIKLTDSQAAEDRPDKLRGRFKGRKTWNYDVVGNQVSYGYSVNPARVAADRLYFYYQRKFPGDFTKTLQALERKVDWEFWKAWFDFNAEEISWDNGTTVVDIPRFDCHVAFTQDALLADALDQICACAGAFWQDDGEKIIFLPPSERDPVHHFDESNIVSGSLQIEPRDLRDRPNYFITEYRDYDDTFLGLASTEVRRDALIKQVGEIKSNRALPNMRKSQADRLTERMARLEADNPVIFSLVGDETSIHVLHGDFVTVSHPIPNWTYQRCLVLSVVLNEAEGAPDICQFTLQAVNDFLYSDTAHSARQEALTP